MRVQVVLTQCMSPRNWQPPPVCHTDFGHKRLLTISKQRPKQKMLFTRLAGSLSEASTALFLRRLESFALSHIRRFSSQPHHHQVHDETATLMWQFEKNLHWISDGWGGGSLFHATMTAITITTRTRLQKAAPEYSLAQLCHCHTFWNLRTLLCLIACLAGPEPLCWFPRFLLHKLWRWRSNRPLHCSSWSSVWWESGVTHWLVIVQEAWVSGLRLYAAFCCQKQQSSTPVCSYRLKIPALAFETSVFERNPLIHLPRQTNILSSFVQITWLHEAQISFYCTTDWKSSFLCSIHMILPTQMKTDGHELM